MNVESTGSKPVGRRPGDSDVTKQAILDAARLEFSSVGFDRATIRKIAEDAKVDPALVIHYFKNKRQLFADAHALPMDPSEVFAAIAELPIVERGEALVHAYLGMFSAPGSAALSMLRAAATNEDAARMLREFIHLALIEQGPRLVEGPDPERRAALIGSHLIGVLFARELLGIPELAEADVETIAALLAPALQLYINP